MLLGDSEGNKYNLFIIFKSKPATTKEKQAINNAIRNGYGETVWREIEPLQKQHNCRIYGNGTA
ncbi:hypothetical protein F441_23038, partial [Phytophthora nicotianae CJ01A1]